MKLLVIIATVLVASLTARAENTSPPGGVLTINITNIEHGSGTLYIAILDSADNWLQSDEDSMPYRDLVHAVTGTDDLAIDVEGLPPGKYAISLFQDLDGDAAMDTNFIGYPREPFGFSAPMGTFGPPEFEDAAIEYSGASASVDVTLN